MSSSQFMRTPVVNGVTILEGGVGAHPGVPLPPDPACGHNSRHRSQLLPLGGGGGGVIVKKGRSEAISSRMLQIKIFISYTVFYYILFCRLIFNMFCIE